MTYTDSSSLTDLSFMEEWPCRGKTLERHDGSSSYCRGPVACSQGLRDPATNLPTVFFPSEFSISHSDPALSTYPLLPKCSLGLQKLSSLCSQASLIPPALSPCDTILKFHPCQDLILTWPLSSPCMNLKMSLMSSLISSICPLSRRFAFFLQDIP